MTGGRPSVTRLEHVALAINKLSLGGSEKQLVLLARGLRSRGVRVTVVSLYGGGPREAELRDAGVEVYDAGLGRLRDGPRRSLRSPAAFLRLVRWFRRERPQVVHAFLYHSYVVATLAARTAGVPVVVAGRRSMGTFKEGRPLSLTLERVVNRMTDLVVANCEAVAREVLRQEGLPPDKLVVIHNGVPPPPPSAAPAPGPAGRSPVVLCVANLMPYKGHGDLLAAAERLHHRGVRFTLVLVGDGPARAELEAQAERTGADVRFLGPRDDVPALMAGADVVVLPSLTEGLSNAVLEAMAAGRPVVATDVGGTREALGDAGVLVSPGSPGELADGLGGVLGDREAALRLAARARERVASLFSVDVMVERHVELYESLVARCAGSSGT